MSVASPDCTGGSRKLWTGQPEAPSTAKLWRKLLGAIATEASVEGFHPHGLRDTFAVDLHPRGLWHPQACSRVKKVTPADNLKPRWFKQANGSRASGRRSAVRCVHRLISGPCMDATIGRAVSWAEWLGSATVAEEKVPSGPMPMGSVREPGYRLLSRRLWATPEIRDRGSVLEGRLLRSSGPPCEALSPG
jgi:hypothetical protein